MYFGIKLSVTNGGISIDYGKRISPSLSTRIKIGKKISEAVGKPLSEKREIAKEVRAILVQRIRPLTNKDIKIGHSSGDGQAYINSLD